MHETYKKFFATTSRQILLNYKADSKSKEKKRKIKSLKTRLGRLCRFVEKQIPAANIPLTQNHHEQFKIIKAIHQQSALKAKQLKEYKQKNKYIYSLHAPEVECIAKGKVHKKYEFGCKVSVATTSQDNWIVGVEALHDNPFDGHTLKGALAQVKRLVGWDAQNAYCDKGYKGNPKQLGATAIHLASRRKSSMRPSEWRWFKRRSAIEPVIGHMKQDNRMDRNYLKGADGDKMNAILAACGFNLRKLLRAFFWLLFKELERLKSLLLPCILHDWAAREGLPSLGVSWKLQ